MFSDEEGGGTRARAVVTIPGNLTSNLSLCTSPVFSPTADCRGSKYLI